VEALSGQKEGEKLPLHMGSIVTTIHFVNNNDFFPSYLMPLSVELAK